MKHARFTFRFARLSLVTFLSSVLAGPALAEAADDAMPSTVLVKACSWDRPGHNPFMGDVVAAVDRYRDIPQAVRARLQARMAKRQYDDVVNIGRDSISGRGEYGSTISDMHFGTNSVCRSVTRAGWSPRMQERGLVYCEGRHCILVPTVCRNVSRITRAAVSPEHAEAPEEFDLDPTVPPGAVPAGPLADAAPGPLGFDDAPSFERPQGFAAGTPWAPPAGIGDPGSAGPAGPDGLERPTDFSPLPQPDFGPLPPPGFGSPTPPPPPVLPAVPEPQTWALMACGLALLAFVQRRRANALRRPTASASSRRPP
jgi:hypothetical protein